VLSGNDPPTQTLVILVEARADFKRLMVALLGREPDFEVVCQFGSLAEPVVPCP
jgi:hypothetical protein